jgi:hypothetical protein
MTLIPKWTTCRKKSINKLTKSIPLKQFIAKFQGSSSSNPPLHVEGVDSNQPLHSHSTCLHHDPHLPEVGVNKFDYSDPTTCITQMEHYFSIHDITDELTKIHYSVLSLDLEQWKWWQWCCKSREWYVY